MSSQLTCIACRQIFQNVDDQRVHYKTDLHRFNLKRKVASLPPVTEDVFQKKISEMVPAEEQDSKFHQECTLCRKHYASQSQWEQHLTTKKHKELALLASSRPPVAAASAQESPLVPEPATPAAPPAPAAPANAPTTAAATASSPAPSQPAAAEADSTEVTEEQLAERLAEAKAAHEAFQCIFCRVQHKSLQKCVDHMARVHSFFIPDIEYLQDLDGLISYLREKATVGGACLWCDRSFASLEAVQAHMRDLSHSKMKYDDENEDEYEDYYDFTASYAGFVDDGDDKKPDAAGTAADTAPQDRALTRLEEAVRRQVQLSEDGYSLRLKDKVIGHRDLVVYYRQRPRPERRPTEAINAVITEYRLLGWAGQKHKNYKAYQSERHTADLRVQSKYYMKLGVKKNRIQTNHPRDQTTLF